MPHGHTDKMKTADTQRLVSNSSSDGSFPRQVSFDSQSCHSEPEDENQLTITRNLKDRKYEQLCFKPYDKNHVDIVITRGQYHSTRKRSIKQFMKEDVRPHCHKGKIFMIISFAMLISMIAILVICLFRNPMVGNNSDSNAKDLLRSQNLVDNSTTVSSLNVTENTSAAVTVTTTNITV